MEVSITKLHSLFVFFGILLVIAEGKAPVGEWTVSDSDGNPCMKMQMAATITIPYVTASGQDTNAIADVPITATTSHSKCDGDSVSFDLQFFYTGWSVWFDYKKSGSKYKLDTIGVGYVYDDHFPGAESSGFVSSTISNSDLPTTHIGSYYSCNKTSFDVTGITLDMSDVKFQPYVQDVSDKGYGTSILLVIAEGKAPVGEWTVSDSDGNPCMKMQMAATITIPYVTASGQDTNAIAEVPITATTSHSKCDGDSVSFDLQFFSTGWSVWFDYKKSGSKYKLDTIGVGYVYDDHFPGAEGSGFASSTISNSDLPTTHIGSYYSCNKTSFDVTGITLDMSNVKFQPYVQDVSDKGYGTMEVCTTGGGGISGEVVMILIIIAVALVIIVPIVVTVACVVRRKRANQQFAYQQQ